MATGETPAATETKPEAKPEATASLAGGEAPKKEGEEAPKAEGETKDPAATDAPKDINGEPIPEKYEWKLPDGAVVDQELDGKTQTLFKDLRLSKDQAEKIVGMYAEITQQQTQQWLDTQETWVSNAKADPVLVKGGFDQNIGKVRSIVAEYGDDELRSVFNDMGVGNHPAVLRFIHKIGGALGEANVPHGGGGGGGTEERIADVFYGGSAKT